MEPPEDRAADEKRPTTTPLPAPALAPRTGEDQDGSPAPDPEDGSAGHAAPLAESRPAGHAAPLPDAEPGALPAEVPAPRNAPGERISAGEDEVPDGATGDGPDGALRRLSLTGRVVVALTVAAVVVGAVFHIGMVFLHIAPANTVSTQHNQALTSYIYPEFEQNWKLFAPDPVQVNTSAQARTEVALPGGGTTTTGWVDMTAMDMAHIRHDPIPSHTVQNELRRAVDFYVSTHDSQDRPAGLRGTLSQEYLLRIMAHRFGEYVNGGTVRRIQVRIATTPVAPPGYASQKTTVRTSYRVLSWWNAAPEDFS